MSKKILFPCLILVSVIAVDGNGDSSSNEEFTVTHVKPIISIESTTHVRVEYNRSFENIPSGGVPYLIYGQDNGKRVQSFELEIVENLVDIRGTFTICEKLVDLQVKIKFTKEDDSIDDKKSKEFVFMPVNYLPVIKNATCRTQEEKVRVQVEELRENPLFVNCVTVIKLYKSCCRNENQFGGNITDVNIDIEVSATQFDILYLVDDYETGKKLEGVRKNELRPCPTSTSPTIIPPTTSAPSEQISDEKIGIIAAAAAVGWRG